MTESQIILYTTSDGDIKVDTVLQNETIWLTQEKMAELFGVQRPAITKHLQNIFDNAELDEQEKEELLQREAAAASRDRARAEADVVRGCRRALCRCRRCIFRHTISCASTCTCTCLPVSCALTCSCIHPPCAHAARI